MSGTYHSDVARRVAQHYDDLSQGHRQIAQMLLDHPVELASLNNVDLAERCGVSVATANRFAKAIGYSGFAEFRAAQIAALREQTSHADRLISEIDPGASHSEVMRNGLMQDLENLRTTYDGLEDESCAAATDLILGARRILVFGSGISFYVAGILVHGLEPFCNGDIHLAGAVGGSLAARRQLVQCRPGDVFMPISVPKYARDTIELTQMARDRGAKVLVLTDHPTSPLVKLADVTLYAETYRRLIPNSMTAFVALAGGLVATVANQRGESEGVRQALQVTESVSISGIDPERDR